MTRLFALAGVDYPQWLALMRVQLLTDVASLRGDFGRAVALRSALNAGVAVVVSAIIGLGAAAVVWLAADTLVASTVVIGTTMWMTGLTVLASSASFIGPDDYTIVGWRPVTSTTYLAARIGGTLGQAGETTILIGWLPLIAFATRTGGSWRLMLAAAVAMLLSSVATSLWLVVLYMWLLRTFPPARIARVMLYAQTLAFLGMTLGLSGVWLRFFVDGRGALGGDLAGVLPRSVAILVLPATWFGAYVELAKGSTSAVMFAGAALALAALVVPAVLLRGRLSLDYVSRVSDVAAGGATAARGVEDSLPFLKREWRAMALLLLAQVRGDLNVQVGLVMGALTPGIMILLAAWADAGELFRPGLLIVLLVSGLRGTFLRSMEHEAIWFVEASPASRARLVGAARDIVALLAIVPAACCYAGWYLLTPRAADGWLPDVAAAIAGGYITLQVATIADPALPFSMPVTSSRMRPMLAMSGSIAGVCIALSLAVAFRAGLVVAAGAAISSVAAMVALHHLTRWRVGRATRW